MSSPERRYDWSPEEKSTIQSLLEIKLPADHISSRPGAGGTKVSYIESWKAIELANAIFGYNGWSSSIVDITPDFIDQDAGKFRVGITAVVKVTLKDGTFHEDVGYGMNENRSKALAIENAKKEAVSDARKRALRVFGNALGNSVYDHVHVCQELKLKKSNLLSVPISYSGLRCCLKSSGSRQENEKDVKTSDKQADPLMMIAGKITTDEFEQTNLGVSSKAVPVRSVLSDCQNVQLGNLKSCQENKVTLNSIPVSCTDFGLCTDSTDRPSKAVQSTPTAVMLEPFLASVPGDAHNLQSKRSKYDAVVSTMEFIKEDMYFDFENY